MRTGTVSYKLEDLRKGVIIPIGMVGENDFTRVIFDAEEVYKKHPDAQVTMKVQPPKGGIYPATVTRDGNSVIWQVKAADVAHRGSGELQLTFTADTMVEKSYIAKTDIKRSLEGNGPAPDPVQDWLDDASGKLAEVEQVLDDLAAMDNIAKTAQASDIGKALSPKTVENGVVTEWEYITPGGGTEDYTDLENKPQIGGVELAGNKSLSDLGIASADDLDDLADDVSDVKNAIDGIGDFVGDTDTDLGTHTVITETDLTDMPAKSQTEGNVLFTTTKTTVSAVGLCNSTKLRTLQDNISAQAGRYEFSIDTPILSSGYQLQIYNVTDNASIYSFTAASTTTKAYFTLNESKSLRIRAMITSGKNINDSHEIHLKKIETVTYDNTVSYVAKKSIDTLTEVEEEIGEINVLSGNKFPVVTFIDDDTTEVNSVQAYLDACDAAGIKGTLATLTIKWENNSTLKNLLKSAEREGHNIILHAYSQVIDDCWSDDNFNLAQCTDNLVHGMQMMVEAGFTNWRYWVTPNNNDRVELRALARQCGLDAKIIGNNWANDGTHVISRYKLYRAGLGVDDTGSITLAQLKTLADSCYEKGGWLIIMTHFANENQNGDYASRLFEMVQYCENLGYQIMNFFEAWSYRKWLYDLHETL